MTSPVKRENLKAFFLYVIALAIFFGPIVFNGKSLQPALLQPHGIVEGWPHGYEGRTPQNTFNIDMATPAYYEWPINKLVGDMYRNGELPLWNPYQGAGTPLLAQYSTRALFPYQILENLSPVWTWDFFLLGRLLIAGFFTFMFLRLTALPFAASFLGGLFYMFSGTFTWFINLEEFANNALMLPVFAWALERLARRKGIADIAIAGLACGMVLLAGQPEIALYILFFGACYFTFRSISNDYRQALKDALRFGALIAAGLLIAGALILPFLELVDNSHHIHPPGGKMGIGTLTNAEIGLSIIAPTAHELPQDPPYYELSTALAGPAGFTFRTLPLNGVWDYLGGYTGAVPLFLTLSGLLSFQSRWKKYIRFFSGFGLFIILKNFGILPFMWLGLLPLFDQVWSPRWAGPVWTFSFAAAGAFGFQALAELKGKELKSCKQNIKGLQQTVSRWLKQNSLARLFSYLALHGFFMLAAQAAAYNTYREWMRSSGIPFTPEAKAIIKSAYPWGALVFAAICLIFYLKDRRPVLNTSQYLAALLIHFVAVNLIFVESDWGVRFVQALSAPYCGLLIGLLVLMAHAALSLRRMALSLRRMALFTHIEKLNRHVAEHLGRDRSDLQVPFYSSAGIIGVLGFFALNAFDEHLSTFQKAAEMRPYYIASTILGSGATVLFLGAAFLIAAAFIKRRKGILAFLPLAFIELWWAMPRGYDSHALLMKWVPLSIGFGAVLMLMIEKRRTALAAVPLFMLSFMWLDAKSARGLPDRYDPFTPPPFVELLKEKAGNDRVMGAHGILFPNFASAVGLQDIRYINSLSTRLFHDYRASKLHRQAEVEGTSSSLWFTGRPEFISEKQNGAMIKASVEEDFIYNIRHYSFLGVKYFVLPSNIDLNELPASKKKGLRFPLVYDAEVKIFENPYAMARAFITPMPASKDESGLVVDENFINSGEAVISEYSFNRVTVRATSANAGLLVLTDLYYPGWTASVNGKEKPIHKVNNLARGVEVDKGENTIVFTYRPKSFTTGAAMSIAGLAATTAAFCIGMVADRRRRAQEDTEDKERPAA